MSQERLVSQLIRQMIICISANPAIDRRLRLDELCPGQVNRALSVSPAPGGKAAHVAIAARALGAEVMWVGFLGGATGEEHERGLVGLGIPAKVVRTRHPTRVNQEIIGQDGVVTEILEPGGKIEAGEMSEMFVVCLGLFDRYGSGARVVLTGSLPPGVPPTFYARLIEAAHRRGCSVLLDTGGEALAVSLPSSPDLIKPNREEAEAALGHSAGDDTSALAAARRFIALGAQSVALSLGSDGLLWLGSAEAEAYLLRPPVATGRSTVGCGDATLAGFAVDHPQHEETWQRAVLAVACGAANCYAESPGMIEAKEVYRLKPLIRVRRIVEPHSA